MAESRSETTASSAHAALEELFSLRRLRSTWKDLRKELTKSDFRDCVDYLEIDLYGDEWLSRLRYRVLSGIYRPQEPGRREAAKGNGVFRVITSPAIEDLLVYRHICDEIYERARSREPRGAFFGRRHVKEAVGIKLDELSDDDYESFFEIWLRYDEYRKTLLMNGLFRFMLITDISNYFEEIQHPLLLEYLAPYSLPRQALGILGQLLAMLRPITGHSPSPAVGLPIDQFDCSRILAHVFLFEHDAQVIESVPERGYVRWMDDQTLGVGSKEEARRLTRELVRSLGKQRLTLNSSKTRILSPTDVAAHFWLSHNEAISEVERRLAGGEPPEELRLSVLELWASYAATEKRGNWDKIAARLLSIAARTNTHAASLEDCKQLLIETPARHVRIFEYLVALGRYDEIVALFDWYLESQNSLYEDVEAAWFECFLLVSPPKEVRARLREIAIEFVRGSARGTGRPGARVPAAMLLYWIGDGRHYDVLAELLESATALDGPTRRTITAILCAVRGERLEHWLALAGRQSSSHVSNLTEWLSRVRSGETFALPDRLVFAKRPRLFDRFIYDARSWLRIELLALSASPQVHDRIIQEVLKMMWNPPRATESVILRRLEQRLGFSFASGTTRRSQGPTPGAATED